MSIRSLVSLITPAYHNRVSEIREQLSATSQEAVTGRQSDITQHLGGRVGKAMISHKMVQDIELQRQTLTLREARLDMTQAALTRVQDASTALGTEMQAAIGRGDVATLERIGRDAEAALEQIFSALNVRHGDRYLFAGDATSTPPLAAPEVMLDQIRTIANASPDTATYGAALDTYFNDPAGDWQTTIYSGTPTSSDPDAVVAIDPALTELIAGLATLALTKKGEDIAIFDTESPALLKAALNIASGEKAVVNLRGDRGVNQEQIAQTLSALDSEETLLSQLFNSLTAKDQYEAATELKELEASLEASYVLTSRLSDMSLLNYLR